MKALLHPKGIEMTKSLLSLGKKLIPRHGRILDLGCGEGTTVSYLRSQGYEAIGIDNSLRKGSQEHLMEMDMRELSFSNESFDALIMECSLSVCGDTAYVLKNCRRLLKPKGVILCSDIYFSPKDSANAPKLSLPEPATLDIWFKLMGETGFSIRSFADETAAWKAYYFEQLWKGIDISKEWNCCENHLKGSNPGYFLLVATLQDRY